MKQSSGLNFVDTTSYSRDKLAMVEAGDEPGHDNREHQTSLSEHIKESRTRRLPPTYWYYIVVNEGILFLRLRWRVVPIPS